MTDQFKPEPTSGRARAVRTPIGQVRPRDRVTVEGVIGQVIPMLISGSPACRYPLTDHTGELDLLFLGRPAVTGLEQGRWCTATGTAVCRDGRIVLWNPRYELHPSDTDPLGQPELAGLIADAAEYMHEARSNTV
jgi:hypothetical protein